MTEEGGEPQEIQITKDTEFPNKPFTLRPIIKPLDLNPGDTVSVPNLVGDPAHMEWWHYQYVAGYQGKKWAQILEDIGWTAEGLSGKEGELSIYGLWGVGYSSKDLGKNAG